MHAPEIFRTALERARFTREAFAYRSSFAGPVATRPGTECGAIVTSQDFFPTLADALGQPAGPRHDGESLLPLLRDPKARFDREALYWHYPHYYPRMTPGSAVREGD